MSSWKLKIEGDYQSVVYEREQRRRRPRGLPRILFIPMSALWARKLRPALLGLHGS